MKVYKKLEITRLLAILKTINEIIMVYVYYVWLLLCRLKPKPHVAEGTEIVLKTKFKFELNENIDNELCSN